MIIQITYEILKLPWKIFRKDKISKVVIRADRKSTTEHKDWYIAPTTSEVALVIVGQEFEKRDIFFHSRDTKLIRIGETHRAYDAFQ